MFTTQIGPPNISQDYVAMLRDYLSRNVEADPSLKEVLRERTGYSEIADLEANDFSVFFKLGVPKLLAGALLEEDWFVDPEFGIETYEFERQSSAGAYSMLHFVLNVVRQEPSRDRRAPNSGHEPRATEAYSSVARKIFEVAEIQVNEATVAQVQLEPSLDDIRSRRRKYYPEGE